MYFDPRIQRDQHTLTYFCMCGATSRHKMVPGRYRIRCASCHRPAIIGNTVMRVENGAAATQRPPSDLSIPRGDAGPATLADRAEETTVAAGKWHSGEPITLELPAYDAPLTERWRDRSNGGVWLAATIALGTRVVAAPVSDPTDRIIVSRREWLASMERLSD